MRTHKQNKPRKLYCSVNTTTRHHSNNPCSEYCWERNRKRVGDELLAKRESIHGGQKHGRDYTPLFYFLIKRLANRGMKYSAKYVDVLIPPSLYSGWSRYMSISEGIYSALAKAVFIRVCLLMRMEFCKR